MALNKKKILKNAQKYTKKGQWDAAIEEYKKLLAENPKDRNLHNTVGDLYAKKGDNEEAIQEYKAAAKSFEEDGFIPQTIALYRKILRIDNTRVEVYSKLAQLYSDQGLTREAISQYKTVADHYTKKGLVKKALDTYKQIADLDPTNLKVRIRLAELYNKEGLKEQAVNEYLKIADILNKKGSAEESFHLLQKVIEIDPTHLDAQKGLAKIYIAKGLFDKAVESLEIILEQDPENLQTLFLIGKAYFKAGSYDQAQAAFERILSIDPSQIGVRENLGRVYLQKDEFDSALMQFEQVIDNFIQKKEYNLAMNLLNRLVQFRPDHVRIHERIIEISEKIGDENRVLQEFKTLATIYSDREEFEKALNIYDSLSQKYPTDTEIRNNLETLKAKVKPSISVEQEIDIVEADGDDFEELDMDGLIDDIEVSIDEIEDEVDVELPVELDGVDGIEHEDSAEPDAIDFIDGDQQQDLELPLDVEDIPVEEFADKDDEVADIEMSIEEPEEITDVKHTEESENEEEFVIEGDASDLELEIEIQDAETGKSELEEQIEVAQESPYKTDEHISEEASLTDDKIIEDHLYHAEVYIKYGMMDKALEHLNSVIQLNADHLDAHLKLFELYKDRANREQAGQEAEHIKELLERSGDETRLQEFTDSAKDFLIISVPDEEPTAVEMGTEDAKEIEEIAPQIKREEVVSEPSVETKVSRAPEKVKKLEKLKAKKVTPTPSKTKIPDLSSLKTAGLKKTKSSVSKQSLGRLDKLAADILKPSKKAKTRTSDLLSDLESAVASTRKRKTGLTPATPINLDILAPKKKKRKKKATKQTVKVPADVTKEIKTAKKLIEAQDFEKAEALLADLLKKVPENREISALIEQIEMNKKALAALAPEEVAPKEEIVEPPEQESQEQLEEIPSAISEDEKSSTDSQGEILDFGLGEEMSGVRSTFDEPDDDFFNLDGDSSEDSLDIFGDAEGDEIIDGEQSTEHSLQELFDEFKKGVDEQVASEDFETHYNLGIAYKEMGLHDEAIAEFEKAAKSHAMFLQCCSMMGICYQERGMLEEAVEQFKKGIDTPGYAENEYMGLLYDLGLTYEMMGKFDEALNHFSRVYQNDSSFREVSTKVKKLKKKAKSAGKPASTGGNVSYI